MWTCVNGTFIGALYHPPRSSYTPDSLLDYIELCVSRNSFRPTSVLLGMLPSWKPIRFGLRPPRLASQASSCLRAGHGTDVDNTVESDLPLVMGSQIVVWKADTVEGLGGLASMTFR